MKVSTKGKYYGSRDLEQNFNEIVLSQYDYTIETTPWHYHENPYFMFVLHGNMLDYNRKEKTWLPPGSLIFHNWQEQHYGRRHSAEAAGFHLEFERSWFKRNELSLDIFEGSKMIQNPYTHLLISKIYFEFLLADNYSSVSIDLLLLQICDSLNLKRQDHPKAIPPWVARLKEILHEDDTDFSLKALSEELGVHPVHISRTAPKYLFASLGDYIRKLKLSKAVNLLLASEMPLVEIAYHCGFSDQSHFNYIFKSYYQVSPGIFRRRVRKMIRC
ncbi:MAG: helix-turn-helix transcriptional regulator [Bacteroidia bacterium]|nr:helix-turn-helix transcriptional regulator [Bacteroidia bacterium]